jgi:hypothetical protein
MTTHEQIRRRRDDQSVVATLDQARRREAGKAPPQQLASLYRCAGCGVWWGSSPQPTPGEHWVFHLIEGHEAQYNWVDYRGWRTARDAAVCPGCGKEANMPAFSLPIMLA